MMGLRIKGKESVGDMRVSFKAGFDGVGVEFSTKLEVGEIGTRFESGGERVVVGLNAVVETVNFVEEIEGILVVS